MNIYQDYRQKLLRISLIEKSKYQNRTHLNIFLLLRRINFTIIIYTESVLEILKLLFTRYKDKFDLT